MNRLLLIGDDDAVLAELAELSRHLDYFEVARLDAPPSEPLGPADHVLIAMHDFAAARRLLVALHGGALPGYAAAVPPLPGASPGARAIVAAATLIQLDAHSRASAK